jgi:hypothetical protein
MSKIKDNTVSIKTTVSLNGKDINTEVKIKVSDIQAILDKGGPQAVNAAIQNVTKAFYNKINENIKDILNEPL